MKSLGIYIHIPFCRSKCLYCDFCSFPRPQAEVVEKYVNVLCHDITARGAEDHTVDTVYFGGGTPTLLSSQQLSRVLESVMTAFRVSQDAEVTAECNPATGSYEDFLHMRHVGFNRLSMGVQSVHAHELRALGRIHSFEDVLRTWDQATQAGFENLSADLMFGIPHQTAESWMSSLEKVCGLQPKHVSAYGLIVEEGTHFARQKDKLLLPDEETTRQMYFEGVRFLQSRGLEQYEISNFSKTGYESRHNIKYWNCDEYIGFGPAAHSDFAGYRTGNLGDLHAYIDGEDTEECREVPTLSERANEYVMLRMRMNEGVDVRSFEERFPFSFEECFGQALRRYVSCGLVKETNGRFSFTTDGMYVSNAILSDILDFSADFSAKIKKTS